MARNTVNTMQASAGDLVQLQVRYDELQQNFDQLRQSNDALERLLFKKSRVT